MKACRHIAILLLICFSAFLGHNLVPHHHHTEFLVNSLSCHYPIPHSNQQKCDQDQHSGGEELPNEDQPPHCHAFNDVVFEKYSSQLVKPLTFTKLSVTVSFSELLSDPGVSHEIYLWEGQKKPGKVTELSGTRDLRGPPALA